jgi:hypothetical protein
VLATGQFMNVTEQNPRAIPKIGAMPDSRKRRLDVKMPQSNKRIASSVEVRTCAATQQVEQDVANEPRKAARTPKQQITASQSRHTGTGVASRSCWLESASGVGHEQARCAIDN